MKPIIYNGAVHVPVTSKELAADILEQEAALAELRAEYDTVLSVEQYLTGGCGEVEEGWERLIEFSSGALFESDFQKRWLDWQAANPKKFLLYPYGNFGNGIYQESFKPGFDEQRKALQFVVGGLKSGNPSLGTIEQSPVFGAGDSTTPRRIRAGQRFRFQTDIEFSENIIEMLLWAKEHNSKDPFLTLVQMKNDPASSYNRFILLLGWNRVDDHLYMLVCGDTRIEQPADLVDFEHYTVINDVSFPLGRRVTLEFETLLDPTGDQSLTRVWWDGEKIVDTDKVNCVPAVGVDPTISQARGIYFGTYFGNVSTTIPEPFSVWYSNMCVDTPI